MGKTCGSDIMQGDMDALDITWIYTEVAIGHRRSYCVDHTVKERENIVRER
jgi:hypothetical protein